MVHGDDFVAGGPTSHLRWLEEVMGKRFECKSKVMGPAEGQYKEISVLNRTLEWTKRGIVYEADKRHAEMIAKE